jgi:hypothetical protein
MRRVTLLLILTGLCLSIAVCGTGLLVVWASDGADLVVPGATNVQISGRGTAHLRVTYNLPPNIRLYSLSQYFAQQGWRRITVENYDRPGPAFTRLIWFGVVREVVVVNPRPAARQTADISLARCLWVAGWVTCF